MADTETALLTALTQHCRKRPLDAAQRRRIDTHMRACGIASIREDGLLFERQGAQLRVFKLPPTASGEPVPL